jgi:hypothetical protein
VPSVYSLVGRRQVTSAAMAPVPAE